MIPVGLFAMLLAADDAPAAIVPPPAYAQVMIQQRIIIRVPTRPAPARTATVFVERKAAKCQPMEDIAAAAVVKPDNIDIIYRGGVRLRAELENACPALDYYGGFYVQPTSDGLICAERDSIRSRSGGECRIKRFRKLVPKP